MMAERAAVVWRKERRGEAEGEEGAREKGREGSGL